MFKEDRVSVLHDEKGSGDGCGDGCIPVGMCRKPMSCTLKVVKMVNYVYLSTIKIKKRFFKNCYLGLCPDFL